MRHRTLTPARLLVLLVLVALVTAAVGCETTTYVGVSYGYPGWGGPCCWGAPGYGPGWGGGVYMGGPVW
jgi:hypothetical protein